MKHVYSILDFTNVFVMGWLLTPVRLSYVTSILRQKKKKNLRRRIFIVLNPPESVKVLPRGFVPDDNYEPDALSF